MWRLLLGTGKSANVAAAAATATIRGFVRLLLLCGSIGSSARTRHLMRLLLLGCINFGCLRPIAACQALLIACVFAVAAAIHTAVAAARTVGTGFVAHARVVVVGC